MAIFNSFNTLLPDPNNPVNDAGVLDVAGYKGPGFFRVKFRSTNIGLQSSRTRSGRGVTSSPNSHMWEFDINYNPLTRDEFEPVASFIESRRGGLYPFFVIIPQYSRPRDETFYDYCKLNTIRNRGQHYAGQSTLVIDAATNIQGTAKPGDYFNINDPNDANHLKTYKVIRVETSTTYQSGSAVSLGTQRLHIVPELTRDVADNSVITFINPKFRVQQKSPILEYGLENTGLFEFSLSVEEILP